MDILVTGGTVFASRYTAEYFSKRGSTVYVLNRGSKPQSKNVIPIIGDRKNLDNILKPYHFDAVIDVTAYNSEDVELLINGLESFDKYILISSSAVYPETLPQPFCETMKIGPNSIWGKSFVFECAEQDRPFYLPENGSMKLQFFHIGDLCRLIEKILISDVKEHLFNTGYPVPVSIKEWVSLCYSIIGKTPIFKNVEAEIAQRSYFPFYKYEYLLNVERMNNILPDLTPLNDSLKESYEWFRNNRKLIIKKPLIDYIENNLA